MYGQQAVISWEGGNILISYLLDIQVNEFHKKQ